MEMENCARAAAAIFNLLLLLISAAQKGMHTQGDTLAHTHTLFICVKFKCKYLRVLKGVFRASICPHIAATQYRFCVLA